MRDIRDHSIPSTLPGFALAVVCIAVGRDTLRPIAPKVIEGEIADIPAEFWQPQPPKLDRKALLSALKEGRDVPGASLSNGGTTISIRRA